MQYISTRGDQARLSASEAILKGLAPDGGLYLPEQLPAFSEQFLLSLTSLSYAERAARVLHEFLTDYTLEELLDYAGKAYAHFSASLKAVPVPDHADANLHVLELYHGPTCAFKDFALQMLPYLLTGALKKTGETREIVILTATSGDTGKAALDGFHDVPGTRILVFYPEGGTSVIQRLQMSTQEGGNVCVLAVKGNFDDAQTGVKRLFSDKELEKELAERGFLFSSANSINWGRLAPQIAYYVSAYVDLVKNGTLALGDPMNVVVPTGNFGNILAAYLAKCCGLPIQRFICASNRNNVLTDFIRTGLYNANRPFYTTASPSMDILISSNLERLLYLLSDGKEAEVSRYMADLKDKGSYQVSDRLLEKLQASFYAGCADDPMAFDTIGRIFGSGYLMDPHTAVGWNVYEQYLAETGDPVPTVLASTASPFKFPGSVLKALGREVPENDFDQLRALEQASDQAAPYALASLEERPERFTTVVEPSRMKEAVKDWLS